MTWTLVEENDTEAYYEDNETPDDMWVHKSPIQQILEDNSLAFPK